MITIKILTLTLLVTTLTLSASLPRELSKTTKQQSTSISTTIANILYRRGIDENKAKEIAQNAISMDEELFSLMISNVIESTSLNKEALFEELSKLALLKRNIDLTSYSFLIKLTQSIQSANISQDELKKLEDISNKNRVLKKVFS